METRKRQVEKCEGKKESGRGRGRGRGQRGSLCRLTQPQVTQNHIGRTTAQYRPDSALPSNLLTVSGKNAHAANRPISKPQPRVSTVRASAHAQHTDTDTDTDTDTAYVGWSSAMHGCLLQNKTRAYGCRERARERERQRRKKKKNKRRRQREQFRLCTRGCKSAGVLGNHTSKDCCADVEGKPIRLSRLRSPTIPRPHHAHTTPAPWHTRHTIALVTRTHTHHRSNLVERASCTSSRCKTTHLAPAKQLRCCFARSSVAQP